MVGRVNGNEIVFSELMIGDRRRRKTTRSSIQPIFLEDVEEISFRWLCKQPGKRISVGYAQDVKYSLYYNIGMKRVYLQVEGPEGARVMEDYTKFASAAYYDGITREIARLNGLLEDFRENGKVEATLAEVLRQVAEEI